MDFSRNKLRVLQVGSFPPPIGGVSMHLKRLTDHSIDDHDLSVAVLDPKRRTIWHNNNPLKGPFSIAYYLSRCDVLHIHVSHSLKVAFCILGKVLAKKVIYTHHNRRSIPSVQRRLLELFCDKIIVVNPDSAMQFSVPDKVVNLSAFLPPISNEYLRDDVAKVCDEIEFIIATNAFALNYIEGKEVYGIDIIGKALEILECKIKHSNVINTRACLVFFDPSDSYRNHPISDTSCQGSVQFKRFTGDNLSFFELLKKSNVCVRATRTDGDPLSVREAIFLGVKVVASDAIDRPDGVYTYPTEAPECLANLLFDLLADYSTPDSNSRSESETLEVTSNYLILRKIYLSLSKQHKK